MFDWTNKQMHWFLPLQYCGLFLFSPPYSPLVSLPFLLSPTSYPTSYTTNTHSPSTLHFLSNIFRPLPFPLSHQHNRVTPVEITARFSWPWSEKSELNYVLSTQFSPIKKTMLVLLFRVELESLFHGKFCFVFYFIEKMYWLYQSLPFLW